MAGDLAAICDAWDKNTGGGRDESKTRKLADAYVKAHSEQFTSLQEMTLEQCVKAVEVFRDAGMVEEQWRVETWLLHHFEPQTIGGTYEPKLRSV